MINNPLTNKIDDDNVSRLILEEFSAGLHLSVINQIKFIRTYMGFDHKCYENSIFTNDVHVSEIVSELNKEFKVIKVWLNGDLSDMDEIKRVVDRRDNNSLILMKIKNLALQLRITRRRLKLPDEQSNESPELAERRNIPELKRSRFDRGMHGVTLIRLRIWRKKLGLI